MPLKHISGHMYKGFLIVPNNGQQLATKPDDSHPCKLMLTNNKKPFWLLKSLMEQMNLVMNWIL